MALQNPWVRYFDRSYQQIKDRVLTNLGALVPEMTDHTESNPFVRMLSIWSGMVEMLGYYVDNAGREAHLSTARLYWSGVKIAGSYDYRIHSMIPATGEIKLTLSAPTPSLISIPAGTIFSTQDGKEYAAMTTNDFQVGDTELVILVKQVTFVPSTGVGQTSGQVNQAFDLPVNIADNTATVTIGSDIWILKETLAYSIASDKHCKQSVSVFGKPILVFGDGFNGAIPTAGSTVTLSYFSTQGVLGNIGAGLIDTIVSSIALPTGITATVLNLTEMVGGANVESLESLKYRVPKQVRTNDRAVIKQDYIDIAELKTGVARAGVSYSCGKTVEVFIVPEGGGIASPTLLADTFTWMRQRAMMLTKILVKPAGEIHILFRIDLNVLPSYQRVLVTASVRDRLEDFLSYRNQQISGTVYLSDIYEIIETTEGVANSQVIDMKPSAFAKMEVNTTTPLDWSKTMTGSNSQKTAWRIKMIGTNTFELYEGSVYEGTHSTGVQIVKPQIIFTVNGSYALNDSWTFVTYPVYGSIVLDEPSIPVSLGSDIVLNATGGL